MKQTFFLVIISLSLVTQIGCKKQEEQPPVDQLNLLPPETTSGARTAGFLLDGAAMVAKDGKTGCWATIGDVIGVYAIQSADKRILKVDFSNPTPVCSESTPNNFRMSINLGKLDSIKTGSSFFWEESDFGTGNTFPVYENNAYAIFYDDSIKKFAPFLTYQNCGIAKITKYDSTNRILSGTFNCKLRMLYGTREKNITNGRFDIKW